MGKIIGIRGHRGAGKNTIAYLIGTGIEYYIRHQKSLDGFDQEYFETVDRIIEEPEFLDDLGSNSDLRFVYFDSFADTAKITLSQIMGLPADWFYDDWHKDSVFVDLCDFSYKKAKDKLELNSLKHSLHLLNAEMLKEAVDKKQIDINTEHTYISLRELIVYYSKCVMQTYFGQNVWVKSLTNCEYDDCRKFSPYRIFVDCKFPTEISYIKNKNGIVVKINRNSNVKEGTSISKELDNDNRYDFEINLDGNLKSQETLNDIKNIVIKIVNND